MHERIRLPIVALNKAEAFHRIEEFNSTACFFAGQRALWCAAGTACAAITTACGATARRSVAVTWRSTIGNRKRFAFDLQFGCRDTPAAINKGEAQRLPFGQTDKPGLLDRRNVHKHIFCAIIANDEAESLLSIEKLYDARAFTHDLSGHAAARSGKTATAAACTAAAAKAATATTAAETVTAAATAVTTTAAAETITAAVESAASELTTAAATTEIVTLVAPAPAALTATPLVETHAEIRVPVLARLN